MEHLKGSSIGLAPALTANIRPGWKCLPGTNTLAYYEDLYLTAVKSFITLAPVILFTVQVTLAAETYYGSFTSSWYQCHKTFYTRNLQMG